MFNLRHKRAVLSALKFVPDYTQLEVFCKLGEADSTKLLRWLDQSGLALYLLSRLCEESVETRLPRNLLDALEKRLQLNRAATGKWLRDFELISESLQKGKIRWVALKGLTLVPQYCPHLEVRHQADIDLWVERRDLDGILSRLAGCGFLPRGSATESQMSLMGPGDERAFLNESIYKPGRPRMLELHFSLLEDALPFQVAYPSGQWERAVERRFGGIAFSSLAPADMFIFQVYHAFTHLVSYWTRLSWLYEIGRFLDANHDCESLWRDVCASIGENVVLREGVGLVIDLVSQLFSPRVSPVLAGYCVSNLPAEVFLWNRHFAERLALSDPMGDKAALLIQRHFIQDRAFWLKHFLQRLFPMRSKHYFSKICGKTVVPTMADRRNQLDFLLQKLRFHGKFLFVYPLYLLRWQFLKIAKSRG
jgi:hypothetical protein